MFPLILFYICNLTSGWCTSVHFSSQRHQGYYQLSISSVYSIHSGRQALSWAKRNTRLPYFAFSCKQALTLSLCISAEPWAQLRTWLKWDSSPARTEGHTSTSIDQYNLEILRLAYWLSTLLKKLSFLSFFCSIPLPPPPPQKQNKTLCFFSWKWSGRNHTEHGHLWSWSKGLNWFQPQRVNLIIGSGGGA